jgi:hypothetical protein
VLADPNNIDALIGSARTNVTEGALSFVVDPSFRASLWFARFRLVDAARAFPVLFCCATCIEGSPVRPETRYADSGGVNIAYQVLGDGRETSCS